MGTPDSREGLVSQPREGPGSLAKQGAIRVSAEPLIGFGSGARAEAVNHLLPGSCRALIARSVQTPDLCRHPPPGLDRHTWQREVHVAFGLAAVGRVTRRAQVGEFRGPA